MIRPSASSDAIGPTPQLTPTRSAPAADSATAASSGECPSASTISSPNVIEAMIGIAVDLAGDVQGQEERGEVAERLEREEVDAAFEEGFDLLAERRPDRRVVEAELPVGGPAERTDRACHEQVAADDVACLARDLGGAPVDPRDGAFEAPGGEPDPVRAEGGRLDDVGAGLAVLAMDRADQVGPGQGQFVEAGALGDPAREEEGPHRPVAQEGARGDPREEAVTLGRRGCGRPRVFHRAHRSRAGRIREHGACQGNPRGVRPAPAPTPRG